MLTEAEVKRLMALAAAYDQRRPPDDPQAARAVVLSWQDASERGRWTFQEAAEAIKAHYTCSSQYLMPGHITALIRANRSQPLRIAEQRVLETSPPASPETVAAVMAQVARELGWSEEIDRRSVMAVACPYCRAAPGEQCARNSRAGRVPARQPHPARRDAAAETQTEQEAS